jgi:hypothetical protein
VFFRPRADEAVRDVLDAWKSLCEVSLGDLEDPAQLHDERVFGPDGKAGLAEITTPFGVIHPALAPAIGERLGLSAAEVLAIARCAAFVDEQGVVRHEDITAEHEETTSTDYLITRLAEIDGEGLVVGTVPVIPAAERPLEVRDGGAFLPGRLDRAYARLLRARTKVERLAEMSRDDDGVPVLVWLFALRDQQLRFEEVCAVAAGQTVDEWAPATVQFTPPERSEMDEVGPDDASGCAFAGEDLLVTRGDETVRLRAGVEVQRYPTPGARVLCSDGKRALFASRSTVDHSLLELESGRWLDAPDGDFPPGVMVEELEVPFLVDLARARRTRAEALTDFPAHYVVSPDGKHVWLGDREGNTGIYRFDDGLPHLLLEEVEPDGDDLPVVGDAPEPESYVGAFALARGKWLLLDGELLRRGDEPVARIRIPATCAAFDQDGKRLALVLKSEVVVLDVSGKPRIVR